MISKIIKVKIEVIRCRRFNFLSGGVGDFWSSRIFFLATWWAGYFYTFFAISFLLHLCCTQFFSSDKRLQKIFFSKSEDLDYSRYHKN